MRIPSWLKVLMTVAILAVVLWHVPVEKLLAAARTAELVWFFPAAATTLVMLFFRHFKWHRLLRAAGLEVSQTDSLRSLLCGFALSVPTPGRVGELGRCRFFRQACAARYSNSTSSSACSTGGRSSPMRWGAC
jgi:uncharacterized membrane protein YbhN (UPF0104 family)